jgi:hypothetical protein
MALEYFNTKFHRDRWKQKQPFIFWYCVNNFYPWKDIVGKKVSKLRYIDELWAFYGIHLKLVNLLLYFSRLTGTHRSWGHIIQGRLVQGTEYARTEIPRRYDQGHIVQGRTVMSATIVHRSDFILLCSNLSKLVRAIFGSKTQAEGYQ